MRKVSHTNLVTITCLVAGCRHNELAFHVQKTLENGLTRARLSRPSPRPFYAGWPPAMTALPIIKKVFQDAWA